MAIEQKLTKQILLDALGKTEDTPEVQKIFQILGQENIFKDTELEHQIYDGKRYSYVDAEDGTFIYTWEEYGIEMHLINENTYYPKKYTLSKIPEVGTFLLFLKPNRTSKHQSCLPICNDSFFYEGMRIDDITEKYGEPNRIWSSEKKNIGRHTYYDLEGFGKTRIKFSFDLDTHEIFEISIVLEEK